MQSKIVLSKYKGGIDLSLNLDELFRYKGKRVDNYIFNLKFSRFLRVVSLTLIVIPVVILILNGDLTIQNILYPSSVLHLLPYFSITTFLFSMYLRRDRDKCDSSLNMFTLSRLQKYMDKGRISEIAIEKFLSYNLICLLDKISIDKNNNFILSLVYSLLSNPKTKYLWEKRLGINIQKFVTLLDNFKNDSRFTFDSSYKNLFIYLFDEAIKLDFDKIDENILVLVLNKHFLKDVLLDLGVTDLDLEGLRLWFQNDHKKNSYFKKWKELSKLKPTGDMNRAYTSRATPTLDLYSIDFTRESAKGKFFLSLGREDEMISLLNILQKDTSSSVMLLGEPGVGKTRFLRYLATKMTVEDVPNKLKDSRLVVVDLNKILTQTGSVDVFKITIQKILDEVRLSKDIILVFEEFSQIMNIREDSKLEVINLISNALDSSNLKLIATSTHASFVKYIQTNKALASMFQTIKLNEAPQNISFQILLDEVNNLEAKYKVSINISALKRIVEFSPKFDFDRVMPEKGIDLLEEACINATHSGLNFVDVSLIDQIVSKKVGVQIGNISSDESELLKNLEKNMHQRVVGQEEAVSAVASAIKRSRSGLSSHKKPIASFLFFGPTGVGKTEIAKTLADVYYGDEKLMIRLDMSEYQEEQNLNRLIGYSDDKGNFVGGFLTEAIRSRPFSLLLLDEIEKANKKVLDLFLQILDEGHVNDGMGRKIDFTNTIIIMTTNVGSKKISDLIIAGNKYHDVSKEAFNDLRENFRIEFLNRFDKLIMFKPLNKIEIQAIVEFMLKKIKEQLTYQGIDFVWDEKTLTQLADIGYNPVYGARELKRVIQEEIEDKLANLIVDGKLASGKEVFFSGLGVANIV